MIFGRKKKAARDETVEDAPRPADEDEKTIDEVDDATDATDETGGVEEAGAADEVQEAEEAEEADAENEHDRWRDFDLSMDWREDGPFDIDEVDLEDDEVQRLDLGSLVITPIPESELRLQMAEATKQIVSALMISGDSAMEISVFAAPRTPGMWAEVRADIIEQTTEAGGTADCVEGPFGTELVRNQRVRRPDGQMVIQPTRTWVAEGPRWFLRGVLYGQAAMSTEYDDDIVGPFFDAFCDLVVRRGDAPRPSGDVLPLEVPEELKQQAAARQAAAQQQQKPNGPIGEGGVMGVARQG